MKNSLVKNNSRVLSKNIVKEDYNQYCSIQDSDEYKKHKDEPSLQYGIRDMIQFMSRGT